MWRIQSCVEFYVLTSSRCHEVEPLLLTLGFLCYFFWQLDPIKVWSFLIHIVPNWWEKSGRFASVHKSSHWIHLTRLPLDRPQSKIPQTLLLPIQEPLLLHWWQLAWESPPPPKKKLKNWGWKWTKAARLEGSFCFTWKTAGSGIVCSMSDEVVVSDPVSGRSH